MCELSQNVFCASDAHKASALFSLSRAMAAELPPYEVQLLAR